MSKQPLLLRSMRARVTMLFGFAVTLIMLIGGTVVQVRERRLASDQMDETLEVAVERAKFEFTEEEEFGQTLLQIMHRDEAEISAGGLALLVTDLEGRLMWSSQRLDYPLAPEIWRIRTLTYNGQNLIIAAAWGPVEERLYRTTVSLIILGSVLVCLSSVGAWLVVGHTLSPIHKLASQASSVSASEPGVRLTSPSLDSEMLHLAETFNGLLERLENEVLSRGRFYSAASHELRTPLQALLGHLDVALSRPREAKEYEKAIREAQQQTVRLTRLVQDLLQLTALDTGSATAPMSRVDMGDLLDRILKSLAPLILQRHISLMTRAPDVTVEAPLTHLEMLLRNLLENAMKYATPASVVEVELFDEPSEVKFRIFNHCTLPEGTDPQSWFEPFYRPDISRNSLTGGNGLGLAIAASVTRVNEWDLTLRATDEGVEAVLRIPHSNSQSES